MVSSKYLYYNYSELTAEQKKQADNYLHSPCFNKSSIEELLTKAKFQFIKATGKLRGAIL